MSQSYNIPFNKPYISGAEYLYIKDVINRGHASGDGYYTKQCHLFFEKVLGAKYVLLTTSCTHALEMAALLLNIKAGDEVIVPSFTFVSTVNAFVLRGAIPIFCDIRPDTFNLDETQLEGLITPRTKAIVPVHYAGVGCDMDVIMSIANNVGISVVEDNAQGLFGKYKDKHLGTFGALSTLSFHETKNIHCGEGGALYINNPELADRAEIIREKGTNRSMFFRGQVDKYSWVDVGSSYLPSDLLAAFLFAQLESYEMIQAKRRSIWEFYYSHLSELVPSSGIQLPMIPDCCQQSYHMFQILLPSLHVRQQLIRHLKNKGILSVFHYLPLHLSEMGKRYGCRKGDCPVTENVSDRLLRLPFYNDLTKQEQMYVIESIAEFFTSRKKRRWLSSDAGHAHPSKKTISVRRSIK